MEFNAPMFITIFRNNLKFKNKCLHFLEIGNISWFSWIVSVFFIQCFCDSFAIIKKFNALNDARNSKYHVINLVQLIYIKFLFFKILNF